MNIKRTIYYTLQAYCSDCHFFLHIAFVLIYESSRYLSGTAVVFQLSSLFMLVVSSSKSKKKVTEERLKLWPV